MPKLKTVYICSECGYETGRWIGKCPSCGRYNSLVEDVVEEKKASAAKAVQRTSQALKLKDVESTAEARVRTGINELDNVLCGGIVDGSLILVGGDPGIGKSTLLLQVCENICKQGKTVLYISGEESVRQIKMRAERLGVTAEKLLLLSETGMDAIEAAIKENKPGIVIVDSIQTVFREEISSTPGSVTQVRECTSTLMRLGKSLNISIIIVGHVTKEGAIAGPRVLEHMVDTVLYFEGERRESYRLIRAVKNRFGSTNEIGVFEMCDKGLREISNPSEYMLSGRPLNVSGTAVTCSIEGTRPILTEVQALCSHTSFGVPRRTANGMDYNRVVMLIAVLEKRMGMQLFSYDIYVNIAGGIKIAEPSLDAAVITAVASSFRNKVVDPSTIVFGEVGLTGELRAVSMADKRVGEAYRLGFKQCLLPHANLKGLKKPEGMKVLGAANIGEMLEAIIS